MHGVAAALTDPQPDSSADPKQIENWTYANKVCRYVILSTLSNELFDVYCSYKLAKEIWDSMILKYTAEAIGRQKFVIGNHYRWEMTDDKDIKTQIDEYHKLNEDLKSENIILPDEYVAGLLIEKLPQSWNDYKQQMKHKSRQLSLADLITHIIIEDTSRKEIAGARAKALASRANLIEQKSANKRYVNKKPNQNIPKFTPTFKNKGNCYVCGKLGHFAKHCRHRLRNGNPPKPNANLVKGDDIFVAVISQVNMVSSVRNWVVDSGATKHICGNRDAFTSYTSVGEGEEQIYLGDSRTAPVHGKGKVLLKLTSGKTLALRDVLHVPTIRTNLISVDLLGKAGMKVSFESGKIIITKDNTFVGKGYSDQGLFVLNIAEIMNENTSSSAYMIDSFDMWHARLGHVNFSYIQKMRNLGLINSSNKLCDKKCEICVETKLAKKPCPSVVERETELLGLIHTDLGDLKQTMTRGGKRYYITFIDDFSRYTKVYLVRNKDEAFNMFLSYKAEVENQLNRKIKRVRSDRGGEYVIFNDFFEKEGIIHEVTPLTHLNRME